jgi:4-diphosphocytidyl-2-C-methyl-D-erythritol kinase
MISFPACKINLGLNILRKREDGYHEIESVMYPVPLTDVLEVVPSESFAFQSSGLDIPGDVNGNLCVRAWRLFQAVFHIPAVQIHLHKSIPMGGGLGGGSSDGAHTLILLNQLFNLGLSTHELQQYAAQLGSDCPFFILSQPQLARGRGEILSPYPVDLSGYYLKIINNGLHISTAEAYDGCNPMEAKISAGSIVNQPIETWSKMLQNNFEPGIFASHPELRNIQDQLYAEGAVYASMSGSGSTMYGIFETTPQKTMPSDCPTEVIVKL